jgi:ketosteroid isomerase-like protein
LAEHPLETGALQALDPGKQATHTLLNKTKLVLQVKATVAELQVAALDEHYTQDIVVVPTKEYPATQEAGVETATGHVAAPVAVQREQTVAEPTIE